ncbi:MAG TPA: winged helix-turn-helix domain-containing protein, partial [Steroidobacteraceae bacterium]|nr:winged helix-turn-helix domain-containing protein [Steroidobacteraceae bacterium]
RPDTGHTGRSVCGERMDAPNTSHVGLAFEHGFRLEALTIEPSTGEVTGPAGREKLDPKVMGVLVQLAVRAGHVVSREDLHEHLWPDAVVTDDALTRCIHELRRHLERAGGGERYRAMIETLPKRGYRLNGVIAPPDLPEVAPQPPGSRRAWIAAAAVLAGAALVLFAMLRRDADPVAPPAAVANSIAVLPFADMSEAQNQGYFADGMAEEILNRLAKSGGLRVISRTSSFSFRGDEVDIPTIAAKLDVSHVLEGSVRRAGDRVRITAQLISAADNSHLWSETYDRDVSEVFAVQDEIAGAVAGALQATLSARTVRSIAPRNPEAYEKFLQGKFLYDRRAPGDSRKAAQYFEEAVRLDSGYAQAWAALSGAYGLLIHQGELPAEVGYPKQKEAAIRAATLDPLSAEAQVRLARYYYAVNERAQGRLHSRRAAELDPNNLLVIGGQAGTATWNNDPVTALPYYRRAAALDPLSTTQRANLASALAHAGLFDEAIREYGRAIELNPGKEAEFELQIGQLHVIQGRLDKAYASSQRLPEGAQRDQVLALLHRAPGREAEAEAALGRLVARAAREHDTALAESYAYRGMHEAAIAATASAWAALQSRPEVPYDVHWDFQARLRISPLLRPLHGDPRYQAVMRHENFSSGDRYAAANKIRD